MTDYTIPMIIGTILAFALGAGFGALWGLSRHEWLYCRVTAHLTWRMREAMKSLGIDEWKIDKVQEYMGSVIIPPYIPMPKPPKQEERDFDKEPYTMEEVLHRLSPQGDCAGEWYCTSRQRKIAWRIDCVNEDGTIRRKLVHDMREHTISKAPEIYKPETVEQLAKKIIDYNFRFLADFDFKEWE